jgi:hypothetical protein
MRLCEICNEPLKNTQQRFCSHTCRNKFFAKEYGYKKGHPGVWLGKKMPFTEETRQMLGNRIKTYIGNETQEQKQSRLSKSKESRDGSREMWVPKIPRGEKHFNWHGDKTDYHIMHKWINRYWKRIGKCEICGKEAKTQWANKDHTYKRSRREDWQELCVSCHRKWDRSHGLIN